MATSKKFICNLCKKVFNQKIEFTKHKNMNASCIAMQKNIQAKEVKNDIRTTLITLFNNCLNILRDNEHLTGDKALRTLAHLLILRLLEPQFGNQINIDTYNYDFSSYEDEIIERHKAKLLSVVRFSNLAKEKEENIPKIMKCLWEDILSVHPITKNIFLKGKGFDIQHQSTYKKLIDKLYTFDFEAVDRDILGEAYEGVIKDVMTGKVLGQFFTPPKVKKMMVKLIDPQLKADGTIEKIFDPAMGTGGFLISSLRHLLHQSKTQGIKMNWDFISNEGLSGREAEPDTYQLAVSNMIIATGHMFNVLEKGDSIRNPITNKYDIVFANPPFGIKGLKYDDFQSSLKSQYIPIKTDNAVSLFIQAIIYMLKVEGKCAVILPDGKDLFSKTNKTLITIREYLMKTCDLKEIIYLPSGIFTYTSIKTCVFYFVKKRDGNDVVETKIKISKSQKETGRDYKFAKEHQTTNVKFYNYNFDEDTKNLLVEVPIEKIASNSYSLNYAEYMKDGTEEEHNEEGIIFKSMEELFNFNNGPLKAMKCDESNIYPVISSSDIHTHSSFELDGENIFILKIFDGSAGKAYSTKIKYFNGKCNFTSLLYHMNPINKDILNIKYVYYCLNNDVDYISKTYQKGSCNKSLDLDLFLNYKIPIPSLKRQQKIVEYLDFIYEKTNKTSYDKIAELKQLNELCINNQQSFGNNVIKTLGEVCNFKNGKGIKKDTFIEGEYPVIGGGQKPVGFHNEYNTDENTILCSSSGYAGFISKYDKKVWASDCFSIIPKNNSIDNTYLYYLLKTIQDKIYKLQTGTAQLHVYSKDLQNIEIPIPSIERQQEIVKYCEHNDTLIKQLKDEIENNKKIAHKFIANITKLQETI